MAWTSTSEFSSNGNLRAGFSAKIRVPSGINLVAKRPIPFPGMSRTENMAIVSAIDCVEQADLQLIEVEVEVGRGGQAGV